MRQRSRVLTCALTAAALIVTFVVVQHRHQSVAAIVARPDITQTAPSLDTTRIVPADVLGTGAVQWAPLTGDGSN